MGAPPPRDAPMPLPACFAAIILTFAPVFVQQRTWRHAELLLTGAILAPRQAHRDQPLADRRSRPGAALYQLSSSPEPGRLDARAAARRLLGLLIAAFVPAGP